MKGKVWMNQNNIGNVWKVFLNNKEQDLLLETLRVNKLPANEAGLKELLLRFIEPEEKKGNRLVGFIEENPEVISMASTAVKVTGEVLRKKLFGK